jgi:molecular chaperone Hsp33
MMVDQETLSDDFVAPFSLDLAAVLARATRLGATALDPILRRHSYPRAVALILGEALALSALIAGVLKGPGKVTIQAQGQGPLPLLVAECAQSGALRGCARVAEGAVFEDARYAPAALFGEGVLAITVALEEDTTPVQGFVPLEGETLAACAETYFTRSAQTPTRIALAIGEVWGQGAPCWRGGGLLMQRIAADDARGDAQEDWRRVGFLFHSVRDSELVDPDLSMARLLYRLFHEEGVRLGAARGVHDQCTCDPMRLAAVMRQFTPEELSGLTLEDGAIEARCQFCARVHRLAPADMVAP